MAAASLVGKFSFAALAGALWLGCNDLTVEPTLIDPLDGVPVRDASPVQTDSLVYRLVRLPSEYRTYVTATYRNTSGGPVFFDRCGPESVAPMFGVGRTGPDSARPYMQDIAWACVGGVPMGTIANGESVTVRVPVGSLDQPRANPPMQPEDLIGLLRVYFRLCKVNVENCPQLPLEQRQSNAFLVTY